MLACVSCIVSVDTCGRQLTPHQPCLSPPHGAHHPIGTVLYALLTSARAEAQGRPETLSVWGLPRYAGVNLGLQLANVR